MKKALFYIIQGNAYIEYEHLYLGVRAVTSIARNRHGIITRFYGRTMDGTPRPWNMAPNNMWISRRFAKLANAVAVRDLAETIHQESHARYMKTTEALRDIARELSRNMNNRVDALAAANGYISDDDDDR